MKEYTCKIQMMTDLERLPKDIFSLNQMRSELREIDATYTAIKATNYDKMPSGSGDNTQEEKLLSIIARRDQTVAWIEATEKHIKNMENLLNTLSEDDYKIIDKTVINRKKNAEDELAEEIGIERRQIYNKKNTILHELCKLRYGRGYNP